MPEAYRLTPSSMAVTMDNYARYESHVSFISHPCNELAEQHGADVASETLPRFHSKPLNSSSESIQW